MLYKIHYQSHWKNHYNKEDKYKYLIDEALQKFNGRPSIHIIRNKETFPLRHILGYLKELWDDYEIKQIFTHRVSLKMELLKKFDNELDGFSSTINLCQVSVAFFKRTRLQDKHHVRSFAKYVHRKM